jgi:alanine-synthesizing transaminase
VHIPLATLAPDLLCLTFNGLSKTYRVAGYRSGWMVITGPKKHAAGFLEGIQLLASTRLCPNVPAQHAVQAALSGVQSIDALIAPTGRLHEQRDAAFEALTAIPGAVPQAARRPHAFPRLDPEIYEIHDDAKFVYDFLVAEHVLLVQGTGFNWPTPDHFRIVTPPEARVLTEAIERLGNFSRRTASRDRRRGRLSGWSEKREGRGAPAPSQPSKRRATARVRAGLPR